MAKEVDKDKAKSIAEHMTYSTYDNITKIPHMTTLQTTTHQGLAGTASLQHWAQHYSIDDRYM